MVWREKYVLICGESNHNFTVVLPLCCYNYVRSGQYLQHVVQNGMAVTRYQYSAFKLLPITNRYRNADFGAETNSYRFL